MGSHKSIYLNLQITNQQLHPTEDASERVVATLDSSPFGPRRGIVDKRDLYKRNTELKEVAEVM
jgi:hypothetical protein